MSLRVIIEGKGPVDLAPDALLGSGGEADVWRYRKWALKVYHDRSKVLSQGKFTELARLNIPGLICPQYRLLDASGKVPVGYAMALSQAKIPLVKLFSNAYHRREKLETSHLLKLLDHLREILKALHREGCLVVDLNEMNVLVHDNHAQVALIDTDSYQTPGFPATALLPSVADPKVVNDQFSQGSDWFSFAVLAFQLFVGVHPYKGFHPKYKPNQWPLRMKDGVSLLHKDSVAPPGARDFKNIPNAYYRWFEEVFCGDIRSEPPTVMGKQAVVITKQTPPAQNAVFQLQRKATAQGNIVAAFSLLGGLYLVDVAGRVTCDGFPVAQGFKGRVWVCEADDGTAVLGVKTGDRCHFQDPDGNEVGTVQATSVFSHDGVILTAYEGQITRHEFVRSGQKILRRHRVVGNLGISAQVFDGCALKVVMGKAWLWLPQGNGAFFRAVPQLDGFRILNGIAQGRLCALIAEKSGQYHRVVIALPQQHTQLQLLQEEVPYHEPGMAILPNGVCALAGYDDLRLFHGSDLQKERRFTQPPIRSADAVFAHDSGVHFFDGKQVMQLSIR